jgi:prephenate dehydrogenase
MKELLPPKRYYVGLLPAINPGYLENHPAGLEGARADLFRHGLMAVAAPQGTASEAVKLGADLAALMDATPFFIDLAEVDGMMAALHLLPQVSAAAMADMMISRPGWNDARKLTGSPFSNATLPVLAEEKGEALTEALIGNQANMLAVLDELVAELTRVRAFLADGDREALGKWMETARQGRERWWKERTAGDWQLSDHKIVEIPKQGLWKRLFGDMGKWFGPPRGKDQKRK